MREEIYRDDLPMEEEQGTPYLGNPRLPEILVDAASQASRNQSSNNSSKKQD